MLTVEINHFKVPAPATKMLLGQNYWYPCLTNDNGYIASQWRGFERELELLERGLVHLSRENAQLHSQALLSFTQTPQKLTMERIQEEWNSTAIYLPLYACTVEQPAIEGIYLVRRWGLSHSFAVASYRELDKTWWSNDRKDQLDDVIEFCPIPIAVLVGWTEKPIPAEGVIVKQGYRLQDHICRDWLEHEIIHMDFISEAEPWEIQQLERCLSITLPLPPIFIAAIPDNLSAKKTLPFFKNLEIAKQAVSEAKAG